MTKELRGLILRHYKEYPQMRIADVFKLIYQNEFGCKHIISDSESSLGWILEEASGLAPDAHRLGAAEPIGNGLCRLNLSALQSGLAPETLSRFLILTANRPRGSDAGFEDKVLAFEQLCEEGLLPFDAREVSKSIEEQRAAGFPAMRHSPQYKSAYAPAYRVVEKSFCDFLSLFCRIDKLLKQKSHVICAIDGYCASGKSTLASLLKAVYDCNVFSMDDFFLRPFQRTAQRLSEPGGNVDYERFASEVLSPLSEGLPCSYRPYDCTTQALADEVAVCPHRLSVVEGVYSLHPTLADAYDLKVFLEVGDKEQKARLAQRGDELYSRFIREWIPLENKYFHELDVRSKCELAFKT